VYTAAISEDNPELIEARKTVPCVLERADFLGEMLKEYKKPIAISGTHGKTTTTSMLSCVMLEAETEPTILVGGELSCIDGNFKIGKKDYAVFEACEYVDSFLKFYPFITMVLNVEEDHLDYFSGIEQIKKSFGNFMKQTDENGFIVLNADDENAVLASSGVERKIITYGNNGKYRAENIGINSDGCMDFDIFEDDKFIIRISLSVTGKHNIYNALAVFATAYNLGISPEIIAKGIAKFTGVDRRFQKKGTVNGATVYDDYAHHPTEIKATLEAAKNIKHNTLWCVFQPHTYTRTKALLNDFVDALSGVDRLIMTDIYAAREKSDGVTSSKLISDRIEGAEYISSFEEITEFLKKNVSAGDIVITMGAGTVTQISDMLVK